MCNDTLIKIENLKTYFQIRESFFSPFKEQKFVRAVDNVSFDVNRGEIFGLAGESGSGKTTIGKSILRLLEPIDGKVYFNKQDILSIHKKELKKLRRNMQMIFQDPYEALNPRHSIYDIVSEPLTVNQMPIHYENILEALQAVELNPPEDFVNRFPHELSGGQRQRVAIASALVLEPKFIVADEPVSMLDVSIKADILNLMLKLRKELNLTFLLITHDLSVIRYICDRAAIMYLGKIVETGPTFEVIDKPVHPYTKALISVIPVPDPEAKYDRIILRGEIPDPVNPPSGCRFHPRCKYAVSVCRQTEPEPVEVGESHYVACHLHEVVE